MRTNHDSTQLLNNHSNAKSEELEPLVTTDENPEDETPAEMKN